MEKKSTQFLSTTVEAPVKDAKEATKSIAGSPRKSTLDLIRRFARCYHCDIRTRIPAGIILN